MKDVALLVIANSASLASIVAAGYLAAHGKDGWGWFLFVGVICTATLKYTKEAA